MELINDVKLHLKNVRTKNSFQIHLLSRLHQVQMNFTENEVLLQKVDVKHHHPKIIKSPCFCIQIQMSPHRSASFPEFCSTVLSKTSNHSHHASYMQDQLLHRDVAHAHCMHGSVYFHIFSDRKLDVAAFDAKCNEICRLAAMNEAVNPVSFAIGNSWNDTLRADKRHHLEYTTRSQT